MPPVNGFRDSIEMIDEGLHSLISIHNFSDVVSASSVLTDNTTSLTITNDV